MSFLKLPKKVSLLEFEVAAEGLDGCVRALANGFPDLRVVDCANLEVCRAVREQLGTRFVVHHAQQDDLRLSMMRLVRIASANGAAIELISAGYTREAYVLWEMIVEAYNDLLVMIGALATNKELRVIEGTFQEKIDTPAEITAASKRTVDYVTESSQRRIEPPRQNAPATQDLSSTSAMLGIPHLAEAVQQQANCLYRSLLAAELVARRTRRADVVERVCGLAADLARITGCDAKPTGRSGEDRGLTAD